MARPWLCCRSLQNLFLLQLSYCQTMFCGPVTGVLFIARMPNSAVHQQGVFALMVFVVSLAAKDYLSRPSSSWTKQLLC